MSRAVPPLSGDKSREVVNEVVISGCKLTLIIIDLLWVQGNIQCLFIENAAKLMVEASWGRHYPLSEVIDAVQQP